LPIGVRVRQAVSLHLGVERRVDQERRDARNVEELRPDGILELALVALVGEQPDRADGQERDDGEERRQTHTEALPEARLLRRQVRGFRRVRHRHIGYAGRASGSASREKAHHARQKGDVT
jgi:hypothetical protein